MNDPAIEKVQTRTKRPYNRRVTQETPARAPARAPTRNGGVAVRGRDGEVLTRTRTGVGDIFAVPPDLIEPGWELQWIPLSVTGNTEIVMDQNLQMLENGWRPVPADRFPGRFMPAGHKGHIIRGQQGLYERPKALCDEARAQDVREARQLISDRNDSLKLSGVKKGLPSGFEMSQRYRHTGGNVKMSIDPALDIPAPSHQLADDD